MEEIKAKSDLFFRYLLGREEDEDLRINFINSVLADSDQTLITSAKVLNPFNLTQYKSDKESILDIKCETEDGRTITIEMQLLGSDDYQKRALYYWSKTYVGQLGEGQHYMSLQSVISIHLLDFNLYKCDENNNKIELLKDDQLHHYFEPREHNNPNLCLTNDMQIHFLEMPKLSEKIKNVDDLKEWVDFFSSIKESNMNMTLTSAPSKTINKAIQRFNEFTADDEMREMYEAQQKAIRDRLSYIDEAERRGRKEGIKEGIKEGEKIGSHNAMMSSARTMLEMNIPIDQIAYITKLPETTIKSLKQGNI